MPSRLASRNAVVGPVGTVGRRGPGSPGARRAAVGESCPQPPACGHDRAVLLARGPSPRHRRLEEVQYVFLLPVFREPTHRWLQQIDVVIVSRARAPRTRSCGPVNRDGIRAAVNTLPFVGVPSLLQAAGCDVMQETPVVLWLAGHPPSFAWLNGQAVVRQGRAAGVSISMTAPSRTTPTETHCSPRRVELPHCHDREARPRVAGAEASL